MPRCLKKILRGFEKEGRGGAATASFAGNLWRRDKTRETSTTEEGPDDDVVAASYDGVMASISGFRTRGGTVSCVLRALSAGETLRVRWDTSLGRECGIHLPTSHHSTARPSLAACLFTTSQRSLRRRAHADTAACDMLQKLRNSELQKQALPHGARPSYTLAPGCITPDCGGWEPQTKKDIHQ